MVVVRNVASSIRGIVCRFRRFILLPVLLAPACETDSAGCLETLAIIVTSGSLYSQQEFEAEARWSAGGSGCPDAYMWTAGAPLSIVGSSTGARVRVIASEAGTARLDVRAGSGTEFAAARDVEVFPHTGFALVTITGLDEGVPADIELTGPGGAFFRVDRDSTVAGLVPGNWAWQINEVTGASGHRWVAINATGTFTILRNTPALLPLAYRRITSQVDFEARGVPLGMVGNFVTLTRDGGEPFVFVTRSNSIAVEPGHFTWTAMEIDDRGYWFVPRAFSGEFTLLPDFTFPFVVDFDAQRGFLDLRANGLPPDVVLIATLLDGANVYTVSIPGAGYRSPADYALDVPDLVDHPNSEVDRFETYRATLPTRQFSLQRGTDVVLVVDLYLARWYAKFVADLTVTADPFAIAPLIGLPPSIALRTTVTQPPPASAGEIASGKVDETIAIIGPPPWVTVTGPLAADSTFTALGTGTVAGYPNVPVMFAGRFLADGDMSGNLTFGSDSPPTGLPGGAVRMSLTGLRVIVTPPPANARAPAANTTVHTVRKPTGR